ncbi:hypothetical protein HYS54_01015 [Candidatus Micrarchaeota archaeon]|nr:hypothetical protein [Candidatus Micrarchaeota archaeon]
MKAIIVSQQDPAGLNVFQRLVERGFRETQQEWKGTKILERDGTLLVRVPEDITHVAGIDALNAELLVFASRHKSAAGTKAFTIHATGNIARPEPSDLGLIVAAPQFGGVAGELSLVQAQYAGAVLTELRDNAPEGFQVTLEATHHGPTSFNTPMFFAELGSSENEWPNPDYGALLADAILRGIGRQPSGKTAIGVGGNHYCAAFNPLAGEYHFGHIAARSTRPALDAAMISQLVSKTLPKPDVLFVDGNGITGKEELRKLLSHATCKVEWI